jgi:uncharacterized RDD family membrane protein YckC
MSETQSRIDLQNAHAEADSRSARVEHPAATPAAAPAGKADLSKRFLASLIDAVIAVLLGLIPVVGEIVGGVYWLVRDGLEVEFMDRRSLGKKVMKLRPVRRDGAPMNIETSARRNWMFALGAVVAVLLFIPALGWLLAIPVALAALVLGVIEVVKVLTDEEGRRWGDRLAGTKVVEVAD